MEGGEGEEIRIEGQWSKTPMGREGRSTLIPQYAMVTHKEGGEGGKINDRLVFTSWLIGAFD